MSVERELDLINDECGGQEALPIFEDEVDVDGYRDIRCSTLVMVVAAFGVGEVLRGSGKVFSMAMRALGSHNPKIDHVEL